MIRFTRSRITWAALAVSAALLVVATVGIAAFAFVKPIPQPLETREGTSWTCDDMVHFLRAKGVKCGTRPTSDKMVAFAKAEGGISLLRDLDGGAITSEELERRIKDNPTEKGPRFRLFAIMKFKDPADLQKHTEFTRANHRMSKGSKTTPPFTWGLFWLFGDEEMASEIKLALTGKT